MPKFKTIGEITVEIERYKNLLKRAARDEDIELCLESAKNIIKLRKLLEGKN